MDRREFLKGLFAATVATQLPAIPQAEAETLAERVATPFFSVDGDIVSHGFERAGVDWLRVWVTFKPREPGFLAWRESPLIKSGDRVSVTGLVGDDRLATMSAYVKLQEEADDPVVTEGGGIEIKQVIGVWGQQIEVLTPCRMMPTHSSSARKTRKADESTLPRYVLPSPPGERKTLLMSSTSIPAKGGEEQRLKLSILAEPARTNLLKNSEW